MSQVVITKNKIDIIAQDLATAGNSSLPLTLDEIHAIASQLYTPTGTQYISSNGNYDISHFERVVVEQSSGPMVPLYYDVNIGYISRGIWTPEIPTGTYVDIYQVEQGKKYFISLGGTVGSRFRKMITDNNVVENNVSTSGIQIDKDINNPSAYSYCSYTPQMDGYLLVSKDNVGVSGLKTYVYDMSTWV